MFRPKHAFRELHEYVNDLNSKTSCPAGPILKSSQVGGTTSSSKTSEDKYVNQMGVFPPMPRIVAIGDIHGDFKSLHKALLKAGIVDTNGDWDRTNKNTIVIQL